VPLSQISWLLTVVVCIIAAVLVLVNGYVGYFAILLAVAAAAAINLR
jgi:Tfp pilus assembly protein PilO